MKWLHILRSEPDAVTQRLVVELSNGDECESVALFDDAIDYDELVLKIFDADRMISWWPAPTRDPDVDKPVRR